MKNHMAIDQHGNTFHNLGPHPRKELCARLSRRHVDRMYRDKNDGSTVHCGWVIGGLWLDLFEVSQVERPVK